MVFCHICHKNIFSNIKKHYFSKEHIQNQKMMKECWICNHRENIFLNCNQCNKDWCISCDDKIQKCPFCRLNFPLKKTRVLENLIRVTENNIAYVKDRIDDMKLKLNKILMEYIILKNKKRTLGISIIEGKLVDNSDLLDDMFILEDEELYLYRRMMVLKYSIRHMEKTGKRLRRKRNTLKNLENQYLKIIRDEYFIKTKSTRYANVVVDKKNMLDQTYIRVIKYIFYHNDET